MKAKSLSKIQEKIDILEVRIARLEREIEEDKFSLELKFARLQAVSLPYGKSQAEMELASDPRLPALLSRIIKLIW